MQHHNLALFNAQAGLLIFSEPFKYPYIQAILVPRHNSSQSLPPLLNSRLEFILTTHDIASILLLLEHNNEDKNPPPSIKIRLYSQASEEESEPGKNDNTANPPESSEVIKKISASKKISNNNIFSGKVLIDKNRLSIICEYPASREDVEGYKIQVLKYTIFSLDTEKTRIFLELLAHVFGEIMFKKIEMNSKGKTKDVSVASLFE